MLADGVVERAKNRRNGCPFRRLYIDPGDGWSSFQKEMCLNQKTIARSRTGSNQPQMVAFQVAISDIVALQGLYCVEPPTARTRTL